jgi:hypothetical protein
MWTNQEGYTFIIPPQRVRRILRRLWDSGFQDLARSSYQGSWRKALRRALGRVLSQSTRRATIRCGNGSLLPVFRSEVEGTVYHFVTLQRRNGNFSILAVRTRAKFDDERFDSRETQRALTQIDQHLMPHAKSIEEQKRLVLENKRQSDVNGNSVQPRRGTKNLPDRSYIAMINGIPTRINVEVDTDEHQQKTHMRVVNRRDPKALNYFVRIDEEGRPIQVSYRTPGNKNMTPLFGPFGNSFRFLPPVASQIVQKGRDPWWDAHPEGRRTQRAKSSARATGRRSARQSRPPGRKAREFEHEALFENQFEHELALV